MSAARSAAAALVLVLSTSVARAQEPAAGARQPDAPPLARLRAELHLSTGGMDGRSVSAIGGELSARASALVVAVGLEHDGVPRPQPDFTDVFFLGAGLAHDLGPDWSVQALAVTGGAQFRLRDVYGARWGDWVWEPFIGLRLDGSLRLPEFTAGLLRLRPFAGLTATGLLVSRDDDTFRRIAWGGPALLVSATLGLETTGFLPPPLVEPERPPRRFGFAVELAGTGGGGRQGELAPGWRLSWRGAGVMVLASADYPFAPGVVHGRALGGVGLVRPIGHFDGYALVLGGVDYVSADVRDPPTERELLAVGLRAGLERFPVRHGVALVYGFALSVLVEQSERDERIGHRVGGVLALASVSLGLGL
ncbi:MAG: hypothetical protein QM704_17725 [Anaeromyxobacteraceae bacterium]